MCDEAIENIYRRLENCDLCPIQCGANRAEGGIGACGASRIPCIYQHFIHHGEETCISPAFVINMAGCNLGCPTCPERMRWRQTGIPVQSASSYAYALAAHLEKKDMLGNPDALCSIEWIGGEPSIHLAFVLEASWVLRHELGELCPLILLNTNGYFDNGLMPSMVGILDGFVFDLKCVSKCVNLVGGAGDYWDVVTGNIRGSYEDPGFREVSIIRHLVMPNHVMCCTKPIVDWCVKHVPEMTFNLMTTFRDVNGDMSGLPLADRDKALEIVKDAGIADLLVNGHPLDD